MGLFRKKEKIENKSNVYVDSKRVYNLKSNGKYEIVLEGNFISITTKGAMNAINKGLVGTKNICLDNVTGVQYKAPGFTTGYLQILLTGSLEVKGGVSAAVKDENSILFTKKEEYQVLEIKKYIENYIQNRNKSVAVTQVSGADELLKYKELLDMGAITQEEFNLKKKQILG